jgi:hypothetical protein
MPKVVNLRGRKPRVVHEGEEYIGHRLKRGGWNLPESKWANPFEIGRDGRREEVIAKYEAWLFGRLQVPGLAPPDMAALPELRGQDLACWCVPLPCHGDVLLRLANAWRQAARDWPSAQVHGRRKRS